MRIANRILFARMSIQKNELGFESLYGKSAYASTVYSIYVVRCSIHRTSDSDSQFCVCFAAFE